MVEIEMKMRLSVSGWAFLSNCDYQSVVMLWYVVMVLPCCIVVRTNSGGTVTIKFTTGPARCSFDDNAE